MELHTVVALLLIGLFGGFVGGMLGIGGSVVMIPALTETFGPDQHLYQAAAMIVNFFVVVPAVYQHRRAKAIEGATVLRLAPLAGVAVVAGVAASELPLFAGDGEVYLRGLFGLFLLYAALGEVVRNLLSARLEIAPPSEKVPTQAGGHSANWASAAAIGIPTGFIAGLLGVGGGIVAVPLQRKLMGVPMRVAVANSAAVIIATSLIGATTKNYAYVTEHAHSVESVVMAAFLIPSAMLGSTYGAKMTHRLPLKTLKIAFYVMLLIAATRLTYDAARAIVVAGIGAAPSAMCTLCTETPGSEVARGWKRDAGSTFFAASSDTVQDPACKQDPKV